VKALVEHLVRGVVSHKDDVRVDVVEGDASLLLELSVHEADVAQVKGANGETLQALRAVVSSSSGRRKAVLELVNDPDAGSPAEASADAE
jgi:predicted RNA-binding protein YlqC (UPF0109 family)